MDLFPDGIVEKNCNFFLYYAEERRYTIPITNLRSTCIEVGMQKKIEGYSFFQSSYISYVCMLSQMFGCSSFLAAALLCKMWQHGNKCFHFWDSKLSVFCQFSSLILRLVCKCLFHCSEINLKWLRPLLFSECYEI